MWKKCGRNSEEMRKKCGEKTCGRSVSEMRKKCGEKSCGRTAEEPQPFYALNTRRRLFVTHISQATTASCHFVLCHDITTTRGVSENMHCKKVFGHTFLIGRSISSYVLCSKLFKISSFKRTIWSFSGQTPYVYLQERTHSDPSFLLAKIWSISTNDNFMANSVRLKINNSAF